MTLANKLIAGREWLLNRIVGTPKALNADVGPIPVLSASDVAAELKRAVNELKTLAIDTNGTHVDYIRLRDSDAYNAYRVSSSALRNFDPLSLRNRAEKLAFWINLYNALVIDAVITFNIQRSVTEMLSGLAFFRRAAYNVGGQDVSCDDIEHGILRANRGHPLIPGPQFASTDPRCAWIVSPMDIRIHFALNCASQSCPPICVYDSERIDTQLDLAAQNFVASEVTVETSPCQIELSRIFQWYQGDFGARAGVFDFLLQYLPDDESRATLRDVCSSSKTNVKTVYRKYDWSINKTW
ncbi:MAG: DUF547 domain-containing protein [Aggregatilineales bacterium]